MNAPGITPREGVVYFLKGEKDEIHFGAISEGMVGQVTENKIVSLYLADS